MKKYILTAFAVLSILTASKLAALPPVVYNLTPANGATSALVVSGPGTLFSIHIASGVPGDYAVCYDTSSASGITGLLNGTTNVPELMRVVIATSTVVGISAIVTAPLVGSMPPSVPIVSFTNGLGCIQNVGHFTNIYYRQPN